MKQIVTSYINPDLDGTASMYAYAEYLNKTGKEGNYYIAGVPQKEVKIVCDMFQIVLEGEQELEENQKLVIVDTNSLAYVPFTKTENVVEIIDHHPKSEDLEKLINAKIQIETLGAVATLIAEKFKENEIPISRNAAILLYYGIISNSVNLKAKVTTKKDIEMANWLSAQCKEIDKEKIKEIFTLKSQIQGDLKKEMEVEIPFDYQDKKIIIGQLEIAEVATFLNQYEPKIQTILTNVKKEKNVDMIFINCIDILNGYSTFVAFDEQTKQELNKLFQVQFQENRAILQEIIMRKEIFKLMNAIY